MKRCFVGLPVIQSVVTQEQFIEGLLLLSSKELLITDQQLEIKDCKKPLIVNQQ